MLGEVKGSYSQPEYLCQAKEIAKKYAGIAPLPYIDLKHGKARNIIGAPERFRDPHSTKSSLRRIREAFPIRKFAARERWLESALKND